jgi:hypothetical protein
MSFVYSDFNDWNIVRMTGKLKRLESWNGWKVRTTGKQERTESQKKT